MKILHLEYSQYPVDALDLLNGAATIEAFDCQDQESLYRKLSASQYDAIITRLGLMMDDKAMGLQSSLKYIVTSTTGLNHIDIEAARKRQIQVVSLKGESQFLASVKSTAEHTWGLLLSLIRHIPQAHAHVMEGGWNRTLFMSDELDGKTLGIIGYGRLGKILAQYGITFGMTVLIHDHHEKNYQGHLHVQSVGLDELLERSDFVSLMISWSPENQYFMGTQKFNRMKAGAYFVNTARGELVEEPALLAALKSGHLKGAALDVLWDDSAWPGLIQGSAELIKYAREHDNLLITPHMGGYGKDSIERTRSFVTRKFLSLIK